MVASLKCTITLKASKPRPYADLDDCYTLGDHLRRTRLVRNESQPCVAQKLGTTTDTITNWERNRNQPTPKHIPTILNYLAYTPLFDKQGASLKHRIEQIMYTHGITYTDMAQKIQVDPQTITRALKERRLNTETHHKLTNYLTKNYTSSIIETE